MIGDYEEWQDMAHRMKAERDKALAAYDAEVIGRREEVAKLHAELGKLRAENEHLKLCLSAQDKILSAVSSYVDEWQNYSSNGSKVEELKDAVIAAELCKRGVKP